MPDIQIRFAQIDPAAKQDITTIATSTQKSWAVPNDLKLDSVAEPGNYATSEWNYVVMDGTMNEFPNITTSKIWGVWTNDYSNSSGAFLTPPYVDITFASPHKSNGITLYFYPHTDDYAKTVIVTWYSGATVLSTGTFTLNDVVAPISRYVNGYNRIRISFLTTNIPQRYIKLYGIDFGLIRILDSPEVSACRIIKEVDPTGEAVAVSTADAIIRTESGIFAPITGDNPNETIDYQHFNVIKDSEHYGSFFLTSWDDSRQSGIEFNISGDNAIGILDLYPYLGGIYVNKSVSSLITELFSIAFPTGLIKYTLDPSYNAATVTGWIPAGSCMLALQHICFAINATVDTERNGDVWIYPRETSTTFIIGLDEQRRRGKFGFTEYFSGVDITAYNYVAGAEISEVINAQLSAGQYTFKFDQPYHSYSATGATILASGANYVRVNVTSLSNVIVTAKNYIDNARTFSVRHTVEIGRIENIKEYTGYTLVNPSNAYSIANQRLDILSKRIAADVSVILNNFEVGYIADIKTTGKTINGLIKRIDMDLRSEWAEMEIIGDVV